jgi:hypothetical protein
MENGQGARAAETGSLAPQASGGGQDLAEQRLPDVQTSQSTSSAARQRFTPPPPNPVELYWTGTACLRALCALWPRLTMRRRV